MKSLPINWSLIEENDNSYIFENLENTFAVNIDYTSSCEYPYSIWFSQLKGQFVLVGFESGAYSTHSKLLEDALYKAYDMMLFLNTKLESLKS